jgi:MoxR-like ATPase
MNEPLNSGQEEIKSKLPAQAATDASNWLKGIQSSLAEWLIGQEKTIELLFNALITDGHVLLEGVPGIGKTFTARLFSQIIDSDFKRIQFTPDLMPSDILGTQIYNQKKGEFEFRAGPVFTNILMIDEINRAPAKTQAALFEVMQEQQVSMDGVTHRFADPFMVIATQNPIEQEGTYALPEAQLDRFSYRIDMGYPGAEQEVQLLKRFSAVRKGMTAAQVDSLLSVEQIQNLKKWVTEVYVSPDLFDFMAAVIRSTRENRQIYLGASPRAALLLLRGSQARALLNGRTYIIPEDVVNLLVPVLGHRLVMNAEAEMEGFTISRVMEEITDNMEIPR